MLGTQHYAERANDEQFMCYGATSSRSIVQHDPLRTSEAMRDHLRLSRP